MYLRGLGRDSFLPTEAALRKLLPLHRVENTDDGAIYSNIFNLTLDPPEWDGWIPVPPIPPNH